MTTIEIVVVGFITLFTIVVILLCLGFDFKKALKWLFSGSGKKDKTVKKKKETKEKVKKEKSKKIKNKDTKEETKTQEEIKENVEPEKKEKAFHITRKGVARIHKKALERDSRSGAIIEQAIKPKSKVEEENEKSEGYENFDDLLNKLKDIGDPDELDDETFKKLFLPKDAGIEDLLSNDELEDFLADDGFVSSESPANGKIDRRLNHFTIDGKHLNLDKKYDDYPSRMPVLDMEHFVFTDRITGRYDNIKMGDVSNIIKPPEENESKDSEQVEEESDEDIFARIMERRRRELGIDSEGSKTSKDEKKTDISTTDLIIADAIVNPKFKKK